MKPSHLKPLLRSLLSIACLLLLSMKAQAEISHRSETLFTGLTAPFAIEVLPDGRYLLTEKNGQLLELNPANGERRLLYRFAETVFRGQGGLMDIALHPDFLKTPDIFLTVVQRAEKQPRRVGVVLWRARLEADGLKNLRIIYRQPDTAESVGHFGSRIAFTKSGDDWTLWLTLGEQQRETPAQDMQVTAGKILALTLNGAPALPRSPVADALPEIATAGHRNPQGIDVHPLTQQVWAVEHGPQGGDELNEILPGSNYGWPLVSYGCPYGADPASRCAIGGGQHAPKFVEPAMRWVPVSTAPSSLRFYRGEAFPQLRNDALMTSLAGKTLWHIRFDEKGRPTEREPLFESVRTRLRDTATDAEGRILLLTDDGRVLRISADSGANTSR
ncbi:MAG: PQQ-dependent sugar dehydrogenase [Burkholderiales bacterium]|nr:PQQ-dependent sugar dehydrogenase [Burkholderiales bacterium]